MRESVARGLARGLILILLISLIGKVVYLFSAKPLELTQPDPVLRVIPLEASTMLAVGLETLCLLIIAWTQSLRITAVAFLWLAVVFSWYHLGLWIVGLPNGCRCFGILFKTTRIGLWVERILIGLFLLGSGVLAGLVLLPKARQEDAGD